MQKQYNTRSKELILEYIKTNRERGVTAADISAYLSENKQQVNLATVYRNLERMTADGMIRKFKSEGDESCHFQYVEPEAKCHEHLHLKCSKCGKIYHLECSFMNDILGHLSNHHHFSLDCGSSVLTGLCADCK